MRRRKLKTWVQVNLRIKEELRRQLEAAAKENQVSFNEEVRARLADSFEVKPRESLAHTVRRLEDLVQRVEPSLALTEAERRQREQEEGGNK